MSEFEDEWLKKNGLVSDGISYDQRKLCQAGFGALLNVWRDRLQTAIMSKNSEVVSRFKELVSSLELIDPGSSNHELFWISGNDDITGCPLFSGVMCKNTGQLVVITDNREGNCRSDAIKSWERATGSST